MPSSLSSGAIRVLTGSYTPDSGGDGPGIAALLLDPTTGRLTYDDEVKPLPVNGASFLAAHPSLDVVYSTNETETGTVSAVARDVEGALSPLGTPVSSGGTNPCHLTVHPGGEWLLTANYGSDTAPGTVAVHRLAADGRLLEPTDLVVHTGRDRSPDGRRAATPIRSCSTRQAVSCWPPTSGRTRCSHTGSTPAPDIWSRSR